jgi:hypothetical protein
MWQDILKRVDIRNEGEYEAASLDDRRKWHSSQYSVYWKRWRTMRNTQVENEDSPMYKEMVELQNLANFHSRQVKRIKFNSQTYYSLDLEGDNNRKTKTRKSPQGNLTPYTELSQEVYETLSDDKKMKYHAGMRLTDITQEERKFHSRMFQRIKNGNPHPTFASSNHGGNLSTIRHKDTSKEEYENMTEEHKYKYHLRMYNILRRSGDKDKSNWHGKMAHRLKNKSKRPTFYSQEEEQKNA